MTLVRVIGLCLGDQPDRLLVTRLEANRRARGYVEALGGTVDVVARVGDWTVKVA